MKIAFNPSTVAALTTPPNNKDITFDLRGRNIFARGVKFCGTDTWRDIKINNVSIGSNILDLRNGSNTTLTNTNGVVTINSTWRPVVDNLTSDSTTSSLSANQGRVLKALIDGKSDSEHTHDDRYLRLTGGWMSGDINFGSDNKIYWGRNTDSASISFKNDGDGDADSYMSFVTSDNGNEYFRWSHSSGSTNTEWMALRSDGLRVGGTKVSLEGHSHNDLYYTKSETDGKYVTLTTPQTIGGSKTFTTGIKFNTNKNGDANLGSGDGFKLFYNETSGSNFPGYYYNVASFITGYTGFQLACYGGADQALKYRHRQDNGTWHPWKTLAFTTDIPSSVKNPYSLTLQANGTTLATYDGSVSKIVNLTYDNVGAASASHTHSNYVTDLGTSGNYLTWTKNGNMSNITVPYATSAGYANGIANKGLLDSQEKIDNFITANRFEYATFKTTESNNVGFASNDGMILSIPWTSTTYGAQMAFDDIIAATVKVRCKSTSWGNWYTLLHSGNYNNYVPSKTGTGASGTWGINITGSAGSVAWGNITGKPSSFTPASHNHSFTLGATTITTGETRTAINGPFAIYTNASAGKAFSIYRDSANEGVKHWVDDLTYHIEYTNDEATSSIAIRLIDTDIERATNKGADAKDVTVYLDCYRNFYPSGNNTGSIGISSSKWANMYATTFHGSLDGNATTATNSDTLDGYHASSLVKFYLSPMASDAPADSAKSWFINTMPYASGAIVYNVPGLEKTIIAGKSSGEFGHMLQLNYNDTYLRILRYRGGSWMSTDWEKISAGYADSAGNADTVDGYHASSFSLTSHTHDYIPRHGMMNSAYACIPTYNGETGWHRIATIQGGSTGYGSYILYLCGNWSYAPNTNAIIHIDTMHTTAQLTQVSGIVGYIDSIRLVNISANAYYVDVHINYTGANTPGTVYCYFLGNGTITPRTSAEKITESVTSSAELDLVNGGRAHSATKVIVNQHTTNDTNYPLVWSNQSNTNSVTENQLYKSWSDLYYNPKNKRLTVGGSIYAAHFYESSDKTLKKNIKSILSSTNIPKIREFDWKDTGEHSYGFIAQELEEQGYGCLVSEANGKKTVNYTATLALTVAKLQNLINIQNKKISNLTKELKALKYGRKKNS